MFFIISIKNSVAYQQIGSRACRTMNGGGCADVEQPCLGLAVISPRACFAAEMIHAFSLGATTTVEGFDEASDAGSSVIGTCGFWGMGTGENGGNSG